MEKNNEEIDLKEILQKTFNFFSSHKLIWIITIVVGIGVGIYKYSSTKIYYESDMIITSGLLYEKSSGVYDVDLQPILSVLSSLETQINAKNCDFTKNALGFEKIAFLKKFTATVFIDKDLTKAEPKNIKIKIEVYDKEQLPTLQDNIVSFCNNNKFIKETFEKQKIFMKNSVSIIDNKLKVVDSIENTINSDEFKKNKVVFLNFTDWSNFVDLELSKFKYENLYDSDSPVIVVQSLSPYPHEINEKFKKSVVFFVLVLIIGVFVAVFIDVFKYLKNE